MNNSRTYLIRILPAHAIILKEVESKSFNKAKQVIKRYEKMKLKKDTVIRYLLKSGKLEGDHRHQATDSY